MFQKSLKMLNFESSVTKKSGILDSAWKFALGSKKSLIGFLCNRKIPVFSVVKTDANQNFSDQAPIQQILWSL